MVKENYIPEQGQGIAHATIFEAVQTPVFPLCKNLHNFVPEQNYQSTTSPLGSNIVQGEAAAARNSQIGAVLVGCHVEDGPVGRNVGARDDQVLQLQLLVIVALNEKYTVLRLGK
jgi:hypothetical protein